MNEDTYQIEYENRIIKYLWQKTTSYTEPVKPAVRKVRVIDQSMPERYVPIKWRDGTIKFFWRPF